jgi:hypothetical protein
VSDVKANKELTTGAPQIHSKAGKLTDNNDSLEMGMVSMACRNGQRKKCRKVEVLNSME